MTDHGIQWKKEDDKEDKGNKTDNKIENYLCCFIHCSVACHQSPATSNYLLGLIVVIVIETVRIICLFLGSALIDNFLMLIGISL